MKDKNQQFLDNITEATAQGLSSAAAVEYALSFLREDTRLSEAMKVVKDSLMNDEGYRISWVANIAMAFKDAHTDAETQGYDSMMPVSLHKRANDAAENFINLLCMDVDSE